MSKTAVTGVTVTTHYPQSDKEMDGDYYDVGIDFHRGNDVFYQEYGDSYLDKGREKAEGFVDALKCLYGHKLPVLKIQVADRED